jgi:hypothetical protein
MVNSFGEFSPFFKRKLEKVWFGHFKIDTYKGIFSQALWRSSSFDQTLILQAEGVSASSESSGHHYLHQAIVITGEAFSRFGVLSNFSPISLHNLLHATNDGFKS